MKKLLLLGIAAALACAAYAYPTLNGATGQVIIPTAAVAPAGQWQIAADWWYYDGDNDASMPLRVLYGINDQFEIGVLYQHNEYRWNNNFFGVNAKYLLPVEFGDAALALGVSYLDRTRWDSDSVFGASLSATKAFGDGFIGTAALLYQDRYSGLLTDSWDDKDLSLGLGAEMLFDNGLSLVLDYVNSLPGARLSMAARYQLTEALSGQLGFVGNVSRPTIGLSYAFGPAY